MPRSRSSPPPPPPSHPPHHRHGPKPRKGKRDFALDGGEIDAALTDIVPDARDRAFVLRCILDEGPRHHRVASWALLRLLAAVLVEVGGVKRDGGQEELEVLPMRLPPGVASAADDAVFPIGLPRRMLREVLDEHEVDLALECLSDGPAHHALANAVMTCFIDAIYERVRKKEREE